MITTIIIILIILYLAIGLALVNKTNKTYHTTMFYRILFGLFWIVMIPCELVNEIIIKGKRI